MKRNLFQCDQVVGLVWLVLIVPFLGVSVNTARTNPRHVDSTGVHSKTPDEILGQKKWKQN